MSKKSKYTSNPCITFDKIDGKPHLKVFDCFYIDTKLPKFKKVLEDKKKQNEEGMSENFSIDSSRNYSDNLTSTIPSINNWNKTHSDNYIHAMDAAIKEMKDSRTWLQKIKDFLNPKSDVDETFKNIKKTFQNSDTEDLKKSAYTVFQMYKRLQSIGQTRQVERMKQMYNIIVCELVLAKEKKLKYITEEMVIDFMLKSEYGVCIDFIDTYQNVIPLNVIDIIEQSHNEKIFDNYCIMYYDKTLSPFRHIEVVAEELKKRDPILFGMIDGSRKLYYITDWIYKDDDLTLDKLERISGQKAIEETIGDFTTINVDNFQEFVNNIVVNTKTFDSKNML